MSDANTDYKSEIDPLFAAAYNLVHNPPNGEQAGEGGGSTEPPAGGAQASEPTDQGAASAAGTAAAPAPGVGAALPTSADLAGDSAAGASAPAGEAPAGAGSGGDVRPDTSGAGFTDYNDVLPQLSVASKQITERVEATYRAQARQEVMNDIEPRFLEVLKTPSRLLAGEQVPSLKQKGQMETLRDSADAEDYKKTLQYLVDTEIDDLAQAKVNEIKPMMSVVQDSIQMFQSNPDLMPGTKQFDKELADQVAAVGKAYELRVDGKLYGYNVPMQPIINQLRTQLSTARGATGEQSAQAQREAQARRAAEQERNEAGQFQGPQGGIQSKSGMTGDSGEDWSTFWNGVGMPGLNV